MKNFEATKATEKAIKKQLTKEELLFAEKKGWRLCVDIQSNDDQKAINKKVTARAKAIKKNVYKCLTPESLETWCKEQKVKDRKDAKLRKEHNELVKQFGGFKLIYNSYQTGANTGEFLFMYGKKNGIETHIKYEEYSRSCQFAKVVRSFTLTIKKGWSVAIVGGLLTFWKGEYIRQGMPCEWIEQGKAIREFTTVRGYLVRGEHINAQSLAEAQNINMQKRKKILKNLLKARAKQNELEEKLKYKMVTIEDSIAAGNCMAGTLRFKRAVEHAMGKEIDSISIPDLRFYAKRFFVEHYANRIIKMISAQL